MEKSAEEEWNRVIRLFRRVFGQLLKSNPFLEKAMLTGITRISRESLFSDMNNLTIATVTDDSYSQWFGFTEEEVFASLDSQLVENHETVKYWYDGFTFGERTDIYNPWSVVNFLSTGQYDTYWANTSSNQLIQNIICRSRFTVKEKIEDLMKGQSIIVTVRQDICFDDLYKSEESIWGLLLSTGYLTGKCLDKESNQYKLRITNYEVMQMFETLTLRWFSGENSADYNDFLKAMLTGDTETMTDSLNTLMMETFSYFDTGAGTDSRKTENFYHGFMLGLVSTLKSDYIITSNKESGRGRYDVCLEPKDQNSTGNAVIFEFKTYRESEKDLAVTAEKALQQIIEKDYKQNILQRGIPEDRILYYGIAFRGKEALIHTLGT